MTLIGCGDSALSGEAQGLARKGVEWQVAGAKGAHGQCWGELLRVVGSISDGCHRGTEGIKSISPMVFS